MENHRSSRTPMVQIIVAMAGWGTIGVFVLESGQPAFNVVFARCVLGAVALAVACLVGGYFRDTGLTRRNLLLAAGGGVCLVFNWVFLFSSFEQTSITITTVVYHTQPFYVLFLGALLFKERLTRANVGWVVLAFVGLVLTTELWTALRGEGLDSRQLLGILNALAAAVLYALATIAAKQLKGVRPQITALIQVLIGIPLLLPFVRFAALPAPGASSWIWLAVLGVFHTGVLYHLLYSAVPHLPSSTIAVVAFVNPAVAIVCDVVVYAHRPTLAEIVGIVLIVLSSLGVTLRWQPLAARRPDPAPGDASAGPEVPAPAEVPVATGAPTPLVTVDEAGSPHSVLRKQG
ncbi:DMT family transporter [Micromonospora wenchangensis]|uniref:DMT family transporter n=2 Tax=Micromonospora wenchangensis TaxID=1185415 RepID=UPI0033C33C70